MSLTRKHYEQFAFRIAAEKNHNDELQAQGKIKANEHIHCYDSLHDLASKLAVDFALDNPRFDRARFLKAAGF